MVHSVQLGWSRSAIVAAVQSPICVSSYEGKESGVVNLCLYLACCIRHRSGHGKDRLVGAVPPLCDTGADRWHIAEVQGTDLRTC